jgi:RNA polymerase sigma-70 factor, ECF subfamily
MFLSNKKWSKEQEELAYSFAAKLYRLALARLGNREDAEDVVQETYFKAFSSIHSFKTGTNMDSWLTTIMLNTLRDHVRKTSTRGSALSLDSIVNETELLPAQLVNRKSPETILEDTEFSCEISSALHELPEFFLLPLLLRDLHDYSYKEIASCLDVPMGTVMSRLARARDFLRQRLHGEASPTRPAPFHKTDELIEKSKREDQS